MGLGFMHRWWLLLCLFFPLGPVWAETKGDKEWFDYGQYLYGQKEYFRAISSFKSLEYWHPQSAWVKPARLMTAKSYLAGGEPEAAAQTLEDWLALHPKDPDGLIYLGLARLNTLESAPYGLREQEVERAVEAFGQVDPSHPQAKYVLDFVSDWKQTPKPEPKSPGLAGGLSALVPGAGSFYLGRYREGTYAFLLTTLFALGARESYNQGNPELGSLLAGVGLCFYGGNVYLAVNSAYKQNDQAQSDRLMALRRKQGLFFIPHPVEGGPSRF
ncbi:MAG: hypothetical protein A2600_08565 [Candidatus Lambdaproteobacteria bacterium RIFOXYD1_FULL_56_27]|uniref:Outer membrane lipoprotein BamD-like domain-containing protein n=1 Tax=Candidatus Lambdaproteobacteria bacterium RIFOXYD2_FULL_56_26 TaxID=1817773 RepID=A0A1F6GMG0_9PROT|nr:MAG: hypothetical protein A2557_10305 [Candidatus Lambdaproteobacteria bacterium RIFOXYD2_FULL_56_26]OGH01796.1 MAG: hypothetical protein A2426_14225 [Candidatus Lambdaproteobacteria bacterium RIFOXYC1_FULL_56_13]OGH07946.1 MAG: hypothetical protein A2600_08565 [Candidatus Lambdaproteobacteria bacterium RIFOXYD1_FULL_56_27]